MPLVMPGTMRNGTPAATSASASSPPRPNTNGSPPLRRTTRLPLRPSLTSVALISSCRADSDEPPRGHNDIYLDLALSQKGVCRHRAFAFLVTALSLGIPTRMVVNEAHAWVEVLDPGVAPPLWRRVDLGGAGRALGEALPDRVA